MAGNREYCIVEHRWLTADEYENTAEGLVHRHMPGRPDFRPHYLKTGKLVEGPEIQNASGNVEHDPPRG